MDEEGGAVENSDVPESHEVAPEHPFKEWLGRQVLFFRGGDREQFMYRGRVSELISDAGGLRMKLTGIKYRTIHSDGALGPWLSGSDWLYSTDADLFDGSNDPES